MKSGKFPIISIVISIIIIALSTFISFIYTITIKSQHHTKNTTNPSKYMQILKFSIFNYKYLRICYIFSNFAYKEEQK